MPAGLVYLPYHPWFQGEGFIAEPTSNGLACGDSYEEAVFKGLCEVVERDAFMIMWLNRLPCPKIAVNSGSELDLLVQRHFSRPGLEYVLIDMTTDIATPSVLCILIDELASPSMIVAGGAAHPNIEHAATKAMLEAAHFLVATRYLKLAGYEIKHNFDEVETFEDHAILYAFGDMLEAVEFLLSAPKGRSLQQVDALLGTPPRQQHQRCAQILIREGFEPVAVDLTTEDVAQLGFTVVRVLVPGLQPIEGCHRHRFLGGSRLREVPKRLGYADREIGTDDGFNPFPHPYP